MSILNEQLSSKCGLLGSNYGIVSGDNFIFKSPSLKMKENEIQSVRNLLKECNINLEKDVQLNGSNFTVCVPNKCSRHFIVGESTNKDQHGSIYIKAINDTLTNILLVFDQKQDYTLDMDKKVQNIAYDISTLLK